MDCPPDWDLLAVVRSCTSTSSAATTTLYPPSPPPQQPTCVLLEYSAPLTTTNTTTFSTGGWQELHEICQPTSYNNNMSSSLHLSSFSCLSSPSPSPSSSSSLMAAVQNNHIRPSFSCISSSPSPSSSSLMAAVQNNHIRPSLSCISSSPSPSSSSLMGAVRNNHIRPSSHVIFGASSPSVVVSSNHGGGSGGGAISHGQRAKKRKNLMKKVCHVPAEGLSSDMWAWRKYGQKPIKGSPYPRGYYRCSSSKGCLARKQVERNRSDPKMFIVTYTSEHNHPMPTHRNSLAGSTRQKPVNATETPPEQPSCSSPSTAGLSPLTERSEVKAEGDEDMSGIFDLMVNDDFYVGFEQLDGGSDDSDCFSEQFSPSSEFPWLSNGSSTATAAGGS